MRVSSQQLMDVPQLAMRDAGSRFLTASRQITEGVRIHRASDGPAVITAVSRVDQASALVRIHQANIDDLEASLSAADVSLGAMSDGLIRVRERLVQARNGSLGPDELRAIQEAVRLELRAVGKELSARDSQERALFVEQAPTNQTTLEIRPNLELGRETVLHLEGIEKSNSESFFALVGVGSDAIGQLQAQVDGWLSSVLGARSDVGQRWELIERTRGINASTSLSLSQERSAQIDTDVAAASTDLARAEAQLRAAQTLFSRIETGGLFALLR